MMRRFAILVVCVLGPIFALAGAARAQGGGLSEEQIHALAERVIAAQHSDDESLDEFERIEHHTVYSGANRHVTDDKVFRVVPTGTGTIKLLLKDGTTPVGAAVYQRQLHDLEQVLEIAANPNDPRQEAVSAKWQKRMKERKDLVDAARQAFHVTSSGQQTYGGRLCDMLELEPNPHFTPHTTVENIFTGTRAKIWVDDASGHLVHGEADIIHDISFGAGILGKLYRGGHFTLDNTEVAPGVWLPSRVQFDYAARKFLFGFESHEVTESNRYRRLGKPAQVLATVRDELAHGAPVPADP
jgi:hypothetical protein